VLRDYFALERLDIEQCCERWVAIDQSQQNRLGGRNCSLGRDLVIGRRVRDRSGKFRISVGPVSLKNFVRFTPTGEDFAGMINLTRYVVGDRLDFDLQVRIAADEVPMCKLSSGSPQRLGWTSWFPGVPQRTSVVFRQPHTQIPQTQFPWPDVPSTAEAGRARTP
jgi:type VI secretion system protein ImpH